MAANTTPIFPLTPQETFGTLTAANTAYDGTGTVLQLGTAGSFGSEVYNLTFQGLGTNVASVAAVYINNGSTQATATNNTHLMDIALPATTASNTTAIATVTQTWSPPMKLKAGYTILVHLRTAVSAGYAITVQSADY